MKFLHLAHDLQVPLDFVTEKHAFIGVTGSGKSYGAQKSAEELWKARAHPRPLRREDVASMAGASAGSGRFDVDLSFLKGLGVLEYPDKGYIQASRNLFIKGI